MYKILITFLILISTQASGSLYVLEGMSGAGKSTTLIHLAPELQNEYFILSELNPEPDSEWARGSIEQQSTAFYQEWHQRMTILKNFYPRDVNFLLDRSYIGCMAFTYAMDKLQKTDNYEKFKDKIKKDFDINQDFTKIIVLDVDPTVSIKRRQIAGDGNPWPWLERTPWPWDNVQFLGFFREFYIKELPELTKAELIYINTTNLSKKELNKKLLRVLNSFTPKSKKIINKNISQEQENILMKYAIEKKLGYYQSKPILIGGFPSIILERHIIQLDNNNKPVFLNNKRLLELSLFYNK